MPAFVVVSFGEMAPRVWCTNEKWLRTSLKAAPHVDVVAIDEVALCLTPAHYDFIMPKDVQALHDKLYELAEIPKLSQMVRGSKYHHPDRDMDVTFIASDPDDGAYLICKYWDRDEDEQAYFGCEASDLRFVKK